MENSSFYIRNMLQHYDRQLVSARRIARYRQNLYGPDPVDDDPQSKSLKRKALVERVAREIVENILLAGTENTIVTDVRQRLEAEFGEQFTFSFPPLELGLEVFRNTMNGPVALSQDEKASLLERLWSITLERVNETML